MLTYAVHVIPTNNHIRSRYKSRFSSLYSVTALLETSDSWAKNFDRGHVTTVVLKKEAFDTVNHDIVLAKLQYFGLRGPLR